jgi:hypothetical protein
MRNRLIHVGERSGAVFFEKDRYDVSAIQDTAQPTETKPTELLSLATDVVGGTGDKNVEYVPWGDDNLQPVRLLDDVKACGVLSGGLHAKIRLGIGRGIMPMRLISTDANAKETLEPVDDAEIAEWMEDNDVASNTYSWFMDLCGIGQDLARIKFNNAGTKIGMLWRHDVTEMRYEPKNDKGYIENVHLSARWSEGRNWRALAGGDVLTRPFLNPQNAISKLKEMAPEKRAKKEYAMVCRLPDWNKHYYSDPLWYAARKWVEIAKGVPLMKAAMFENNIRLKYKVVIYQEYWDTHIPDWSTMAADEQEAARKEVYDEIDNFLAGAENAYKSIFVDGKLDPVTQTRYSMIDIEPIEDTTKQGELLPDSAAANIEILFALMMNPALMGAGSFGKGYGGGAGSGSDIREATMVQIMIQEFERQCISKKLNLVAHINGWKDRIPNLVWRFPGMILTTLDKGKSTESIVS